MQPRQWLVSAAALLSAGLFAFPLTPSVSAQPAPSTPQHELEAHPCVPDDDAPPRCPGTPRVWGGGEFLLWWVKDAPLLPLAAQGPFANPVGGPVLLGGDDMDYGTTSGMRFTVGGWLGSSRRLGLEGSGFLLEQRSDRGFVANAGTNLNSILVIPYVTAAGAPNALFVGFPGGGMTTIPFAGSVGFNSTTRLWGAEINGLGRVWNGNRVSVDALAGFRYLDLDESLDITATEQNATTSFGGPFRTTTLDEFHTRNQVYGGQLGSRAAVRFGNLSVIAIGKVILGSVHQVIDVNGATSSSGNVLSVPVQNRAGGVFTNTSNIGTQSRDVFTAIPEAQVKLAYDFTPRLCGSAGYNFLYMNNVVRPADQVDPRLGYAPRSFLASPAPTGPPPAPQFNTTDYWAHGVSIGLEFKY